MSSVWRVDANSSRDARTGKTRTAVRMCDCASNEGTYVYGARDRRRCAEARRAGGAGRGIIGDISSKVNDTTTIRRTKVGM